MELAVRGVELEHTPDVDKGEHTLSTSTPVLVKQDSRYLAPTDPGFIEALQQNLRHKADLLDVPSEVEVDLLEAGPMRRFLVAGAPRHGATVTTRVVGDPQLLTALHDWGLGLANNQGFGWIR